MLVNSPRKCNAITNCCKPQYTISMCMWMHGCVLFSIILIVEKLLRSHVRIICIWHILTYSSNVLVYCRLSLFVNFLFFSISDKLMKLFWKEISHTCSFYVFLEENRGDVEILEKFKDTKRLIRSPNSQDIQMQRLKEKGQMDNNNL